MHHVFRNNLADRTARLIGVLGLIALAACEPRASDAPAVASTVFGAPWNSGIDRQEPAFHVQTIDPSTIVLRQSITTTFEAPFLYLLFGDTKALLIDTGVEGVDLRGKVDRLMAARKKPLSLVVMHSHGHTDHVGGDAAFKGRPDTVVVGHSREDVARFFAIDAWPTKSAAFDLGGRVVDILPTPGHQDAHVMVFDRATRILFSGDTIYPGNLYFQCAKLSDFRASIDRVAIFAAKHDARWLLGAHIEMTTSPGKTFPLQDASARPGEHLLELPRSVVGEIQAGLAKMGDKPRVEAHRDFVLFPHPADPRGKQPPNWCL
jgi:glyoxylase-like metal-dependent hydrolase (beta-lactamase superfamily II)